MHNLVVAAIVVENNKVLVVKEADSKYYGKYNIPAGHVEPNESILKAAVRELKEETGYDISLKSIVGIHNICFGGKQTLIIVFKGEKIGEQTKYVEDEIIAVEWLSISELENLPIEKIRTIPGVEGSMIQDAISKLQSGKEYPLDIINEIIV